MRGRRNILVPGCGRVNYNFACEYNCETVSESTNKSTGIVDIQRVHKERALPGHAAIICTAREHWVVHFHRTHDEKGGMDEKQRETETNH